MGILGVSPVTSFDIPKNYLNRSLVDLRNGNLLLTLLLMCSARHFLRPAHHVLLVIPVYLLTYCTYCFFVRSIFFFFFFFFFGIFEFPWNIFSNKLLSWRGILVVISLFHRGTYDSNSRLSSVAESSLSLIMSAR
jgi:hypothetical protein